MRCWISHFVSRYWQINQADLEEAEECSVLEALTQASFAAWASGENADNIVWESTHQIGDKLLYAAHKKVVVAFSMQF